MIAPIQKPFDSNTPLLEFYKTEFVPQRLAKAKPKYREKFTTAFAQLRAFLKRPATVADLDSDTLEAMLDWLAQTGRSSGTARSSRQPLLAIGAAAAESGLIAEAPFVATVVESKPAVLPWTTKELNQLFGSARTMHSLIDGIPAKLWWPALLLVVLDTDCMVEDALAANLDAYGRRDGTLAVGPFVYRLHHLTVEAIEVIKLHEHERLLPWPWDMGKQPFHILYRRFRQLLYRARLAHVSHNLFNRLSVTSKAIPDVLDHVNLSLRFKPRLGRLRLPRARNKRNWEKYRDVPGGYVEPAKKAKACSCPPIRADRPVLIASNSEWTLRRFFEEKYLPLRMVVRNCAESSIGGHRQAINRLCDFAGCDVTLEQLSDDLIEGFMGWLIAAGKSPATANGRMGCILAQWRYAWRKRLVEELPRDVDKLPLPKVLPTAWNTEEMGRLLAACAKAEGEVSGIPAGLFWTALVSSYYETGLRRAALLSLRCKHLDFETGILFVPAEVQKQSADQMFKLHPDTLKLIRATRPETRHRLFPWDHHDRTLGEHLRRILIVAGLPHGRRDLLHKIRRTSGTYVQDAVGPQAAQDHLGHSSQKMTKRYVDPRLLSKTHASDVLPRPVWDASELLETNNTEGVDHV